MAKNTTLRKLDLRGESYFKVPVLHGVAGNTTIEDIKVCGELIEGYFYLPRQRCCSLPYNVQDQYLLRMMM